MSNEKTTTVQDEKTDAATSNADFTLMSLLDALEETDPIRNKTLTHHLYQSDTMARAGLWDAAASEARSALDALVDAVIRDVLDASPDMQQALTTTFKSRRRVLFEAGVIDSDDNEFLAVAVTAARPKIKHCIDIDAAWATAARRLVHVAATHLLIRYAAWRERNCDSAAAEVS